jgi:hypothetical protein
MDFERGLKAMQQFAQGTSWEQDFLLYEARLRANLRDEQRFGATEHSRNERARIVDQLNALALANLPVTFNQLCLGTQPLAPAVGQAVGQGSVARPHDSFMYDAFLSFSQADRGWVYNTLLPHLERAGVRICLPERDFALGRPRLVNIEEAIQHSRRTLLIMTPDWLADEWAGFEALLIHTSAPSGQQPRMLPIKARECEVPERLKVFETLDLTDSAQFTAQLERLVKTIVAPQI